MTIAKSKLIRDIVKVFKEEKDNPKSSPEIFGTRLANAIDGYYSDNSSDLKGDPGPQGPAGPQGPQGPQGIPGSGSGSKERRHTFITGTSYNGSAPLGSLESDSVWRVVKIEVATDGSTIVTEANNIKWDDITTETYV